MKEDLVSIIMPSYNTGKFIKEINGNSKEIRINHINLVNGGYLLKIYKKEEILTKKVLK